MAEKLKEMIRDAKENDDYTNSEFAELEEMVKNIKTLYILIVRRSIQRYLQLLSLCN